MNRISEKFKTKSELRSSRKKRADICYYKEHNKGNCMVEGTIQLHPWCKYCIKIKKLKKGYKKGVGMNSETLFKEAFKCFNSKNGDCPISYSDPNLFDRCFYCLEKYTGIEATRKYKRIESTRKILNLKKGIGNYFKNFNEVKNGQDNFNFHNNINCFTNNVISIR